MQIQDGNNEARLNDSDEPVKKQNHMEKRKQKHSNNIESFDLRQRSPLVKNGFVACKDRKSTDLCFNFLYNITVCLMVSISLYGFSKGNYKKLIAPVDANNNLCGFSDGFVDFPYLFVTDLNASVKNPKRLFESSVCVSQCPLKDQEIQYNKNVTINQTISSYDTFNLAGFCLPKDTDQNVDQIQQLLDNSSTGRFFNDLYLCSRAMYLSLFFGLVYTYLYMYAMSRFSQAIAMFAILLIESFLIVSMGGSAMYKQWIPCGVVGAVFFFFNLLLICQWRKLKVAISVIDASADFLIATKRLVFVQIFYFILSAIIFVIWLAGIVGVVSMNDVQPDPTRFQGKYINFSTLSKVFLAFMVFGVIWTLEFYVDKTKFIVMVCASQYYFSSSKDSEGSSSVLSGLSISYTKHYGSIALGSLLHLLVSLLRMIVDIVVNSLTKESKNPAAQCIGCLIKCYFARLQELIEYLNATAYSMIAISGDSYCNGAWNGFILNLKHCIKLFFATTIANLFVLMGVTACTAINAGTAYILMKYAFKDVEQVSSVYGPIIFIMVSTFITAMLFLSQFSQGVRATMMCLAVDLEINQGVAKNGPPTFHQKIDHILKEESHNNGEYQGYEQLNHSQNNYKVNQIV